MAKGEPRKARRAKKEPDSAAPKAARGRKIKRYTLVDWYDISPAQFERMSPEAQIAHRLRGHIPKVEEEWVRRALEAARPKRGKWPLEPDPVELCKIVNALLSWVSPNDVRPPTPARIKRQLADIRDATQALADKLACITNDQWDIHASAINDVAAARIYGYRQEDLPVPKVLLIQETLHSLKFIMASVDVLQKLDWPQASDVPWVGPNDRVGEMQFISEASFAFGHLTGTYSFASSPTSSMIRFLSALAEPLGFETSPDRLSKKLEVVRQRYLNGRAGYRVKLPFGNQIILANLGKRS